jgi:hypothetical protein
VNWSVPRRQILTHSSGRGANVSVACVTVLLHGQLSAAPSGSLDTDRTPDSLNLQVEGREPLGHFRPIWNQDHFSSENRRMKLGHSKLSSQVKAGAFKWTEENLAILGTVSDNELVRKLGIIAGRVFWKREKLSIPAFFVRWSPAEIALLGTDTDRNVARLLGRSELAVKNQRTHPKIPAYR